MQPKHTPNGKAAERTYRLAAREASSSTHRVVVGNVEFGDGRCPVIAGPCSVESREQILATARAVKAAGGAMLRGGAYKPRTSPYDFQGLGEEGLSLLAEARAVTGLPFVTEVLDTEDVALVASYADMLQIGARNMGATRLLQKAARSGKPILLKRGLQATVKEWLLAAEYILAQGNDQVVLCERGIRSFDSEFTRNVLDLGVVPVLRQETRLPIIVDPSHATGRSELVGALARAALAVGAHGLMIEVHPCPDKALSDGRQSLTLDGFASLMASLRPLAAALSSV